MAWTQIGKIANRLSITQAPVVSIIDAPNVSRTKVEHFQIDLQNAAEPSLV